MACGKGFLGAVREAATHKAGKQDALPSKPGEVGLLLL